MRVIVLVTWGPRRWQKALIEPRQRLTVGRHARAGLSMPHDERMSGLHFELTWDGSRCELRDLESLGGTELNGEPVASGEVSSGDWIKAGETIVSVYFEGQVPPWPHEGRAPASAARKAEALAAIGAEQAPLFAVLDAARRDRILTLLRASPESMASLYDGREGEELEEVAPYLVSLSGDGWLLGRLVEEGWGDGWGIYLTSRQPFAEVRRHLRRLLIVDVRETQEQLYFRFYDPRALRAALEAGNARQRQQILGDVEAFVLEGKGGAVEVWRRER
jgi:hypothetical protein